MKEITVNYQVITILNSGNSRLYKQCRETQTTLFFPPPRWQYWSCIIHSRNAVFLLTNSIYCFTVGIQRLKNSLWDISVISCSLLGGFMHTYILTWSLESSTSGLVAVFFFCFFRTNLAKQEVMPRRSRLKWLTISYSSKTPGTKSHPDYSWEENIKVVTLGEYWEVDQN